MNGHQSLVNCVAAHASFVLSGSSDGQAKVRDRS